ncbi:MAG: hypothetical protein PHT91_03815 [Candidatus Nanoarchaeia archaeon]|nr:hypothetical protein [Candidatus Nanoarchaeia archaeon]MDD5054502.1 hypothetical protein [Candidatus Nanoarchaeia archaeon]MDD5499971.1 hypothetical protein [Candidatus Nanoarchaeia archaeon]
MNNDNIYSDLEKELSPFYNQTSTETEATIDNINQYLTPFATLKYFVDNDTGKFLYIRDEKTGQFKGLDYKKIIEKTSEFIKYDSNKKVDEAKTNEYIDEVFEKTNRNFQQLKLIKDFGNYSRFHFKFGNGQASSYLPKIDFHIRMMKNVSEVMSISGAYFVNAVNSLKNLVPAQYKALEEKIMLVRKSKASDALWINDFLNVAEIKAKPLTSGFNMTEYLDKKLLCLVSGLDKITSEECSRPLMNNSNAEFSYSTLSFGISPEIFKTSTNLSDGLVEFARERKITPQKIKQNELAYYFTPEMLSKLN